MRQYGGQYCRPNNKYGTGTLSGFVRANGRTIGSSTSGATERANADTQSLFEYLWGADSNLTVSGGRGASANADWTANKTIALPDWAGRAIAGLDDMGAGAKGRLTSSYFGADATVLGATGGAESQTLTQAQMPQHSHSGTTGVENQSLFHSHGFAAAYNTGSGQPGGVAGGFGGNTPLTTAAGGPGNHNHNFTTSSSGGGGAHNNVPPTMLATIFIKL
jgi:microcystin-dependent protein